MYNVEVTGSYFVYNNGGGMENVYTNCISTIFGGKRYTHIYDKLYKFQVGYSNVMCSII